GRTEVVIPEVPELSANEQRRKPESKARPVRRSKREDSVASAGMRKEAAVRAADEGLFAGPGKPSTASQPSAAVTPVAAESDEIPSVGGHSNSIAESAHVSGNATPSLPAGASREKPAASVRKIENRPE